MRREVGRAISWRGISVTAFVVCAFLSGYAWTPADAVPFVGVEWTF